MRSELKDLLLEALLLVSGRVNYERIQFRRHLGYLPNLQKPRTFNEKVAVRKLIEEMPSAPVLSDKIAVRHHVANAVGDKYLNEVFQIADQADEIDFDQLPDQFVAKVNHGSHMNAIVSDKSQVNREAIRDKLRRYLSYRFGRLTNEWW